MAFAIATNTLASYSPHRASAPLAGSPLTSSPRRSRHPSSTFRAATLSNHADSDIVPSILYAAISGSGQERGRSTERKVIHSSSPSPPGSRRASDADEAVVRAHAVQHHDHHQLPSADVEEISFDPILYLPPLLSPLPASHPHQREHERLNRAKDALRDFETRLPDIDPASLALHQALHSFAPVNEDYASTSYDEAFNWSSLTLPKSVSREWYCVVFRSRRKPESANLSLYKADREAHEEAVRNGGLVMYWYGVPDETGLNLATCIWQSRRHAIKAIAGPKHMKAMRETQGAYETYALERWVLSKRAGEKRLRLDKWIEGEVGW
ncbi:hypothetical protein IAU60_004287 [Kwoniella sp. DSM 27419]